MTKITESGDTSDLELESLRLDIKALRQDREKDWIFFFQEFQTYYRKQGFHHYADFFFYKMQENFSTYYRTRN